MREKKVRQRSLNTTPDMYSLYRSTTLLGEFPQKICACMQKVI